MKKILVFSITIVLIISAVIIVCIINSSKDKASDEKVKIGYYTFGEGIANGGWVQIKENNEFSFNRSGTLSYRPEGKYEIKGNTLILIDNPNELYEFKISDDNLIFQRSDIEYNKKGTVFTYQGKELKWK